MIIIIYIGIFLNVIISKIIYNISHNLYIFENVNVFNEQNKNICYICENELFENQQYIITKCGHKMHSWCREDIMKFNNNKCKCGTNINKNIHIV
jgi:hypothetical protein